MNEKKITDEDIIELLKNNEENEYQLKIEAKLMAIETILIHKNIITLESFKEVETQCLEKVRKEQLNRTSKEVREQLETLVKFFKNI